MGLLLGFGGGGGSSDKSPDPLGGIILGILLAAVIGVIIFAFYMEYRESRWKTVREEMVKAVLVDKYHTMTSTGAHSRHFVVKYENSQSYIAVDPEFYEKYNPNDEVSLCRIWQVNPDGEKQIFLRENCE